jgi:surfeit locus 1 family protein
MVDLAWSSWVCPWQKFLKTIRLLSPDYPGTVLITRWVDPIALIPVTAFVLGTWQVKRLEWKTEMIAKFEDRLVRPPLPLPPKIDPDVISEFDYRRVYARGHLRHDQEMLIGPRMHEGEEGFTVITPLERGEGESMVLINRGWVSRKLQDQKDRPLGVPKGEVVVEGLLREPIKKNMFTPDNIPEEGRFYFPDVPQMAELTGSQPVLIEETMGRCFWF